MKRLSEYFHEREFACKCCGTLPPGGMDTSLINRLTILRKRIDVPLKVISGYRCPKYNRRVGGAKRSQHLQGRAADVRAPSLPALGLRKIFNLAMSPELFYRGGIGVYSTFIHLDTRGWKARWGRFND